MSRLLYVLGPDRYTPPFNVFGDSGEKGSDLTARVIALTRLGLSRSARKCITKRKIQVGGDTMNAI